MLSTKPDSIYKETFHDIVKDKVKVLTVFNINSGFILIDPKRTKIAC